MDTLQVMVCDDEVGVGLGIERVLRKFTIEVPEVEAEVGFELTQAGTAEDALRMIEESPPDLLLLDLKLPGMSGIDLLERVAPKKLDMLVVMISAYASIEAAVKATKQGAYDFLPKPFTPKELKSTVAKASRQFIVARQAKKLAQERRRVRFEFISVVAHELKAPMNAIEGYLNIMEERALGEGIADYDQVVSRCLVRMGGMRKMIADLLDMTRVESGLKKRSFSTVDLADTAQSSIENVTPEADGRGITITQHIDGPIAMEADAGEIEIILNNLLTNAVKYNRDGGSVDLTVEDSDDAVKITVKDTGIGMSADDLDKLFKDFVRIKNDKTKKVMGTGLGLSILKKITQLYDGDVSVTSEPDVGTTFTVTLSKSAPRPEEQSAPTGAA
jgi:signal transduction histidine kinase